MHCLNEIRSLVFVVDNALLKPQSVIQFHAAGVLRSVADEQVCVSVAPARHEISPAGVACSSHVDPAARTAGRVGAAGRDGIAVDSVAAVAAATVKVEAQGDLVIGRT